MQRATSRHSCQHNQKHSPGFTLIELLVTLSVLSILAFYATPFFSQIIQQQNLETAKNRIVHSLQKARRIANAENTFVDVNISDSTIQLTPKNKTESITINIPGRIIIDSAVSFTFNSMGTLSNEDGQSIDAITNIKINPRTNPSLFETITVSNTGIIASL